MCRVTGYNSNKITLPLDDCTVVRSIVCVPELVSNNIITVTLVFCANANICDISLC